MRRNDMRIKMLAPAEHDDYDPMADPMETPIPTLIGGLDADKWDDGRSSVPVLCAPLCVSRVPSAFTVAQLMLA
jgi:hypothetical protein